TAGRRPGQGGAGTREGGAGTREGGAGGRARRGEAAHGRGARTGEGRTREGPEGQRLGAWSGRRSIRGLDETVRGLPEPPHPAVGRRDRVPIGVEAQVAVVLVLS